MKEVLEGSTFWSDGDSEVWDVVNRGMLWFEEGFGFREVEK